MGAKTATALVAFLSLSLHLPTPEQAPLQRTKRIPAAGLGVSTSRAPAFHFVVQLTAQARPGKLLATEPAPAILTASLS
jgi:hypothetical protein